MLKFTRKNKKLVIPVGINPSYNIDSSTLYNTTDADVVANDVIAGKIAYGADGKIVGTLDVESEKATSYNEGIEDQKAKLETITITENGTYNREDGYNEVIVEVPDLNGDYNEGLAAGIEIGKTEGINEGREEIIAEQNDANITSYDVIEGKIGYSKNNEKIVGTYHIPADKLPIDKLIDLYNEQLEYNEMPLLYNGYALLKWTDKFLYDGNGCRSFTYNSDNGMWEYVKDVYGQEWYYYSNSFYDSWFKSNVRDVKMNSETLEKNTLVMQSQLSSVNEGVFNDIEYRYNPVNILWSSYPVDMYDEYNNTIYPYNLVENSDDYSSKFPIVEFNGQYVNSNSPEYGSIWDDVVTNDGFSIVNLTSDRIKVRNNLVLLNPESVNIISSSDYFYLYDTSHLKFDSITITPGYYLSKECGLFKGLDLLENIEINTIMGNNSSSVSMYYAFKSCKVLKTITINDAQYIDNVANMFSQVYNMTNIVGFKDLGKGFNASDAAYKHRFEINYINMTRESCLDLFNNIYDLNINGVTNAEIRLNPYTFIQLSSEDIAIATSKGWTVF